MTARSCSPPRVRLVSFALLLPAAFALLLIATPASARAQMPDTLRYLDAGLAGDVRAGACGRSATVRPT